MQRNKKNRKNPKKPAKRFAVIDSRPQFIQNVPRNLLISPDIFETRFKYTVMGAMNSAGAGHYGIRFRPTALYDVDPVLGSTAIAGFNEYAALYNNYRVVSFTTKFVPLNLESFPIHVVLAVSNLDPGAGPAAVVVKSWFDQSQSKDGDLSAKFGVDKVILTNSINVQKYVGSRAQQFDDSYASQVSTVPTNNVFVNLGIYSPSTNFVNGIIYRVTFTIVAQFYERVNLVA